MKMKINRNCVQEENYLNCIEKKIQLYRKKARNCIGKKDLKLY